MNLLSKFKIKKTGTEIEIADASARATIAEQNEKLYSLNEGINTVGAIARNATENKIDDVTLTNENGIYTLSESKNGTITEIGTIETSSANNPLVEVKDSIVENNKDAFDFHTLQETTEDGTENDIVKFYMAQKQIISISKPTDSTLIYKTVDQSGNIQSHTLDAGSLYLTSITYTMPEDIANGDLYIIIALFTTGGLKHEVATFGYVYNNLLYVVPYDMKYISRSLIYVSFGQPNEQVIISNPTFSMQIGIPVHETVTIDYSAIIKIS